MAKSIWKPGVKITRKEKKALRRLMPHPNKGRKHYQWRVENSRISHIMKNVLNDDGTLNIVQVAKRSVRVSHKLTMKREFAITHVQGKVKGPIFTEVDNVGQNQEEAVERLIAGYRSTVTWPELQKRLENSPLISIRSNSKKPAIRLSNNIPVIELRTDQPPKK